MYNQLQSLDSLSINFNASGMHLVNIILAFIMFGVALEIRISDFKTVFLHPKALFVGLFSQLFALPFITFILASIGYKFIPPGVAMGMILVAACPGGNMSNFISSLAKGNVALSVSLTAVTTTVAVITTPLNFELWGRLYVHFLSKHSATLLQPLQISIPNMLFTLTILLLLPLIAGFLCARYLPKVKRKIVKPLKTLSLASFFVILGFALANNWSIFLNNLFYIFIIVLIHNGLALATGYSLAALFRLGTANRRTIMIETGIQNSGLGLAMQFNPKIFPVGSVNGGMLFVTAWWGIWHIVSGLAIALICRKRKVLSREMKKMLGTKRVMDSK